MLARDQLLSRLLECVFIRPSILPLLPWFYRTRNGNESGKVGGKEKRKEKRSNMSNRSNNGGTDYIFKLTLATTLCPTACAQ